MNLSVVMAAYNGETYIREQIISIVSQLEQKDELIISDDGSTDKTRLIVREIQDDYPNVILVEGPKEGIAANFENGIRYSRNEIIAFTDQDDVWVNNKADIIKRAFMGNANIDLIMHNAGYIDAKGQILHGDIFSDRKTEHGFLHNIVRSTYYGCCMAFRREFLSRFYNNTEKMKAYDQYLGLCAEQQHVSLFLNEILIFHRVHSRNESRKLSPYEKLKFRYCIVKDYFHYTSIKR